jgi:Fic family protein
MPHDAKHLLDAHQVMMSDIIKSAGSYRKKGVGIHKGKEVVHVAPPAGRVPELMDDLLDWLKATDEHPLVSSCIFHYELEFIHPFMDGNGRMGRLWQTLILSRWRPVMAWLPVETVIRDRQQEYYDALGVSDKQGTATNFVEFMLEAILQAMEQVVTESRPESQPESRPESELANKVLDLLLKLGPMGKSELAKGLGHASVSGELKKQVKLLMEGDWIEFTVPEKPNSRMQKYRVVGR